MRRIIQPHISTGAPTCSCPAGCTAHGKGAALLVPSREGVKKCRKCSPLSGSVRGLVRAHSTQTAGHNRAGGPLRSVLDLSDLLQFQQPIPSLLWSLCRLLATFPVEKPLWSCPSLQRGSCELEGKVSTWLATSMPSWWLKVSNLPPAPPVPHLPQTQHQWERAAGEQRGVRKQRVRRCWAG